MDDPIEAAEALIAAGRADEAARDLRARLAAGRGGLLARLTLVKALLAAGDVQGALAEAREAVSLNPDVAVAVLALGEALLAAEALPTAIAELQRALAARSRPGRGRALLIAAAWLEAGEADKALEILRELDDPPPAHDRRAPKRSKPRRAPIPAMCAICSTSSPPITTRACSGSLAYAAPQILRDLAELVMPGREQLAHPGSGLRHRPGGRGVQAAGGAAGRHRPVAGHDRKGAGARNL